MLSCMTIQNFSIGAAFIETNGKWNRWSKTAQVAIDDTAHTLTLTAGVGPSAPTTTLDYIETVQDYTTAPSRGGLYLVRHADGSDGRVAVYVGCGCAGRPSVTDTSGAILA
jgi:hypothetical protein